VLDFVVQTKERGHSSIFITHNIHHIYQVADRIVVLRHGKLAGDVRRDETDIDEVIDIIMGVHA